MMFIFQVPEGTDVTEAEEEIQQAIASVNGEYPSGVLHGTQPISGYQITLVQAQASQMEIETLITNFDLDWTILASQDQAIDQSLILPFFLDVPSIDASGNVIYTPVTDLTDKIQVYAGQEWTY